MGDVNGDGKLDLVAVSGAATSVLLGNGDGTFQNHIDSVVAGFSSYVLVNMALADLNGDGKLDVATYGEGKAVALLGNGDGTFRGPYEYHHAWTHGAVAAGDFNGDGTQDLVIVPVILDPTESTMALLHSVPAVNLAPPG